MRLMIVHVGMHINTCCIWETRPGGYKTFFLLNSAEHEMYPAQKC